jgi:hypothetical protein
MVRRTLALIAILLAVAALGASPAHAGGPTSVLLSAPPHVVAFGYEDPAYGDLQQLTEVAGGRADDGNGPHDLGQFVRATWLIHDMSVWRIDIIYPEAPGGPWIATTESMTTGTMPEKPTWHIATNPSALVEFIRSLKLLNGQTFDGGPTTIDSVPTPVTEPTQAPLPAQTQVDSTGFFTGWRWTIPGFLVGAAVAVLAIRLIPKRRWDLVDLEP